MKSRCSSRDIVSDFHCHWRCSKAVGDFGETNAPGRLWNAGEIKTRLREARSGSINVTEKASIVLHEFLVSALDFSITEMVIGLNLRLEAFTLCNRVQLNTSSIRVRSIGTRFAYGLPVPVESNARKSKPGAPPLSMRALLWTSDALPRSPSTLLARHTRCGSNRELFHRNVTQRTECQRRTKAMLERRNDLSVRILDWSA